MQRPQQTALPLARALGCAVRVRDDLHEIAMTFTGFSGLPGVRTLAGLLDDNGKNLMATTAAQIKARAPGNLSLVLLEYPSSTSRVQLEYHLSHTRMLIEY